jgi:hypothetical protein
MKNPIKIALLAIGVAAMGHAIAQTTPNSPISPAKPLDVTGFFAEVDKDHDGCITAKEWYGLGLPKSALDNLLDANGCITLAHLQSVAPPPGIDTNGDGKLTVAEFLAFAKKPPAPTAATKP